MTAEQRSLRRLAVKRESQCDFRFYEELNDFLPSALRKRDFSYAFDGSPAVKDAIEAIGVPHTAVDLVLINGISVDFTWRLEGGERVAVYPMFERLDITSVTRLRATPLRVTRFVLDVHLGKLARLLRLFGVDAKYRNDYDDSAIVQCSLDERRIILTRDKGLLKRSAVTHGYWLRETDPRRQLREILREFDLFGGLKPFTRCIVCNNTLEPVDKQQILHRLPVHVRSSFEQFSRCSGCSRVFWRGSHYQRMRSVVESVNSG